MERGICRLRSVVCNWVIFIWTVLWRQLDFVCVWFHPFHGNEEIVLTWNLLFGNKSLFLAQNKHYYCWFQVLVLELYVLQQWSLVCKFLWIIFVLKSVISSSALTFEHLDSIFYINTVFPLKSNAEEVYQSFFHLNIRLSKFNVQKLIGRQLINSYLWWFR